MKRFLKVIVGYFVALAYVVSGKRSRLLKYYEQPGTCLAIVGHDPKGGDLERLLKWYLKRGFVFIRPEQRESMKTKGRIAWLSFDDGWISFKTEVLPILGKLNIPATVFIAPHETEQGQLWTNGTRPYLGQAKIKKMYAMPHAERQEIVDGVFKEHGNPRKLLAKEDVIELAKHPLVDVQNHTLTHLSCKSRPVEEVVAEVEAAQRVLREWTGKVCSLVCYPFCHATKETDQAIQKLGLIPVRGDAGEGTIAALGMTRNMFKDRASLQENIGRSLNAWRKVLVV